MNRQLLLHHFVKSELQRYDKFYKQLEHEYINAPKGSLVLRGHENYSIALRENGRQYQIALKPDDTKLLHQIKNKRYITEALPILRDKISACNMFLINDTLYDPLSIEESLPKQYANPATASLFLPGDINPSEWYEEKYKRNSFYPEKLIHNTLGGLKTRSKSEAMIGTQLEAHNLPPRYEPLLLLGDKYVAPDFVFILPNTRRLCLWEHLGLIDNPEYTMHNLRKLDEYARNGYHIGYNLIITYETKNEPLTIEIIESKIHELLESDKWFF